MTKTFYFIDNNYPECIYRGTEKDMQDCLEHGGYPEKYKVDEKLIKNNTYKMRVRLPGGIWRQEKWEIQNYGT